ncbi:hypothetical protein D3C73_1379600 [compost metagenome]
MHDGRADVRKILAGFHDVQIEIWLDGEQVEHLVEHFAVLACNADLCIEALVRRKCKNQRGHLDSFGPSAEDAEGFH